MLKSANLLHKCGLGDSDMNITVTKWMDNESEKELFKTQSFYTFSSKAIFSKSFSLLELACSLVKEKYLLTILYKIGGMPMTWQVQKGISIEGCKIPFQLLGISINGYIFHF